MNYKKMLLWLSIMFVLTSILAIIAIIGTDISPIEQIIMIIMIICSNRIIRLFNKEVEEDGN